MKRNYLRALGGVAMAAALIGAAGCQDSGSGTETPSAQCGGTIATFGAFTGPNAGLVIPSLQGSKLAVKQFNEANPNCKVTLQEFDTQGDPAQATPIANQIAGDQKFLGVIGGAFSGESKATMPIYEAASLAMVSPSATNPELTAVGNKAFHRVVGNDSTQGAAASVYFKNTLKSTKVFLIDDGTTYGAGIIKEVKAGIGSLFAGEDKVQEKQTNFDATVSKVKGSQADAIAYGGYTNEAAPLLKQLRAAGITAKFVGFDGLYDPGFVSGAGAAAEGAIVTCPCLPADKAGGTFAADFQKEYGVAPGSYGAEGFDAATVFLEAFKAGKTARADILAFVKAYDKQGVSKYIKFDTTGDVDKTKVVIWAYEVKGGAIVAQSEIALS
ncbi:branched-chain amino acid ABC transporter substrate-binding protein [Catellatospora sp. NPDC049609]|uniref:branched-chain amino acid ABC transporter substrate-binding protein n=1 Tax=Catellatospora sp. NPDC049609 TaxID=3155505 RepID=UPI00343DEF9A